MREFKSVQLANDLRNRLHDYNTITPLPGINDIASIDCFIKQLIDSIRRVEYVEVVRDKANSPTSVNPHLNGFNPIKAAAYYRANNDLDEATWLIFLATQFSKNRFTGWQLVKDVYGMLGEGTADWTTICQNPQFLGEWIAENKELLNQRGKFGNHRKYESLKLSITGRTINSYVNWIGTPSHAVKFAFLEPDQDNSMVRFNTFYNSMNEVFRFGRTAKFDYLTMLGKLGLVDLEPDSVYMTGATGPYRGACLLFAGDINANLSRGEIDNLLRTLGSHLELRFAMQVLEDSLCNWQKRPQHYKYFNG
jgi:hypothetical protein